MDEQMREKFEQWYSDGGAYPKTVERSGDGAYVFMGAHQAYQAWQACAAALSQPAAQGDSSHSAGGGVPAPNMELVNLARRAINKHWDFETLKYGDDLYGKEHLADAVWDFVEECQAIGRTAFDKKYPGAA